MPRTILVDAVTLRRLKDNEVDYARGYIDGLTAYAWWRDGEQYVGTTGTRLSEAIHLMLAWRGWARIPDPAEAAS